MGAAEAHGVIPGAVGGRREIHPDPLHHPAGPVEEGHAVALHRLDQGDVGDPVVRAPVVVPVEGVVEEGEVPGAR
jgi:hypothetical protein